MLKVKEYFVLMIFWAGVYGCAQCLMRFPVKLPKKDTHPYKKVLSKTGENDIYRERGSNYDLYRL